MKSDLLRVETERGDHGGVVIILLGQRLHLLPERALFWEDENLLVVSDAHFGKIGAFRAGGIPLPPAAAEADAERLSRIVAEWAPRECLFLGDLFHSRHNDEWELLRRVFREHPSSRFSLVEGNHDVLGPDRFRDAGLQNYGDWVCMGPFCFSHDRMSPVSGYNFFGHLHPGVEINGRGGDSLRLPAFLFRRESAVLPAFGGFTGTMVVPEEASTHAFAIGDGRIFPL